MFDKVINQAVASFVVIKQAVDETKVEMQKAFSATLDSVRTPLGVSGASVTINGVTYAGSNVEIDSLNNVWIDGEKVSGVDNDMPITITIEGNVESVSTVRGSIHVTGDVENVASTTGDIDITGNVEHASATSGDITADTIIDAHTTTGDINVRHIG